MTSIQESDLQSRKSESLHLRIPQPITETCDVDAAQRTREREMLRSDGAYAWSQVQDAFRHWLEVVQPPNAMTLAAMLSAIRRYANGGEL